MNICRCCLSDGCNRNLSTENYEEMFLKTFNLNISHPSILVHICEECLQKLHQAVAFKQKVLDMELMWLDTCTKIYYSDCKIENESKDSPEEDLFSPDNTINSNTASDVDFDVGIEDILKIKDELNSKSLMKKEIPKKQRKDSEDKRFPNDLRENTLKLVTNSNLCIFKILRRKYSCYDCPHTFFHIKELRAHSKIHLKDTTITDRMKRLSGMTFYNADISHLTCKICAEICADLDVLMQHLLTHGITFGNASHCLIPYKIEDNFQCVYCNDNFDSFFMLCRHMNVHSTSNVCETCGAAFFNRQSLRQHVKVIHRIVKCTKCSITFPENKLLQKHITKVHKSKLDRKRYCIKCNQTFHYTYLLQNHMVEKHGESQRIFKCTFCDQTAKCNGALRIHVRSVHLKERNFKCSMCEAKFFTKFDKKRHEISHQDVRVFACNVCETRFKSKDSMRRHTKRQHAPVTA